MHKKLLEFERDCKNDLEQIKSSFNEFNIFNVLGVQRREIRHSNFLGWLFDPNDSHQLDSVFLKDLLVLVSEAGSLSKEKMEELLEQDLSDTVVHREKEHIDILIVNKKQDFVICIENKIDANFSPEQLADYYKTIEKTYSHTNHRSYITLTPFSTNHHVDKDFGEKYYNISYVDIIKILSENNKHINNAIPTVRESIKQYKKMVEKEITRTNKEVLLAQEIYGKYKEEIDFIVRNQDSFSAYKTDILNYINSRSIEGLKVSHNSENRNVIFLLPDNENVLKLFRFPKAKSRGGDYIFSLVINFEKDSMWIKFGFGEIVESENKEAIQLEKDRLFDKMKEFKCFKKEKLNIDFHNHSSKAEFPSICGVPLFNREMRYAENKTMLELFKVKFEELNKELIQPWVEECIEKLSKDE